MATISPDLLSMPASAETSFSQDMHEKLVFLEQNMKTPEHIEDILNKTEEPVSTKSSPNDCSAPQGQTDGKNDAASLSLEGRIHHLDPSALQIKLREQLALLEKLLQELMNFTSSPSQTIENEIKELSLLYRNFLDCLSLSVSQKDQPPLLQKLYRQLFHCSDILLRTHLPEITSLFETYHISSEGENLRSAFLYLITGKRGLETEIKNPALTKIGGIYGKDRQYSASFQSSAFRNGHTDSKDVLVNNPLRYNDKEGFLAGIGMMSKKAIIHIVHKLQRAEQFIKYVNNGGDLYTSAPFTAKNDEFLGFLMAELIIKTQIYSDNVSSPALVDSSLRNIIQKLIDYNIQTGCSRDIFRVYMHTMNLYQTSKSPKTALETGLKYALEQFMTKKETDSASADPRYSKESGFFQIKETERSPQALLAENIRLLEKDWKKFLKTLDGKESFRLSEVFSNYSPWASAIAPKPLEIENAYIQFSAAKLITTFVVLVAVYLLFFS